MQSDGKFDYIFHQKCVMFIIFYLKFYCVALYYELYYITTRTMKSASRSAGMGRKERRAEIWWGNMEGSKLRNLISYGMVIHVSGIGPFFRFTSLFLLSGM
jgi:hypothetical protein